MTFLLECDVTIFEIFQELKDAVCKIWPYTFRKWTLSPHSYCLITQLCTFRGDSPIAAVLALFELGDAYGSDFTSSLSLV